MKENKWINVNSHGWQWRLVEKSGLKQAAAAAKNVHWMIITLTFHNRLELDFSKQASTRWADINLEW